MLKKIQKAIMTWLDCHPIWKLMFIPIKHEEPRKIIVTRPGWWDGEGPLGDE